GTASSALMVLNKETPIRSKMTVNGSAATKEAVWRPCSPLLMMRTATMADMSTPQMTLTRLPGLGSPFVVIIPSTKVAESADVTRNVTISKMKVTDSTVLTG